MGMIYKAGGPAVLASDEDAAYIRFYATRWAFEADTPTGVEAMFDALLDSWWEWRRMEGFYVTITDDVFRLDLDPEEVGRVSAMLEADMLSAAAAMDRALGLHARRGRPRKVP